VFFGGAIFMCKKLYPPLPIQKNQSPKKNKKIQRKFRSFFAVRFSLSPVSRKFVESNGIKPLFSGSLKTGTKILSTAAIALLKKGLGRNSGFYSGWQSQRQARYIMEDFGKRGLPMK
jgi:hypothetical protein